MVSMEKECAVVSDFTMSDALGIVLDASNGNSPYEYLHGYGQVAPYLEQALEEIKILGVRKSIFFERTCGHIHGLIIIEEQAKLGLPHI